MRKVESKKKLENNKVVLQLDKEIRNLEKQIKHLGIYNAKIRAIKSLKISSKAGRLVAPYVLTTALTVGVFSISDAKPFFTDEYRSVAYTMKEIDSFGNVKYMKEYADIEITQNVISYYEKWEKVDDDFYSRNITTYSMEDVTEDDIMTLLDDDISSLEEVFGQPVAEKVETRNNLTEEELLRGSYVQGTVFNVDQDDYITTTEPPLINFGLTLLWAGFNTALQILPKMWRYASGFDYQSDVTAIKNKYQLLDADNLAKKLEIKRDNYDRLMRK